MNTKRSRVVRLALLGTIVAAVLLSLAGGTGAQNGGTLGYGSRAYGTIAEDAPVVAYGFPGSAGDRVAILAESWTGTLEVQIDVVAPTGAILGRSTQNLRDNDPAGAYLSLNLPEAGVYLARVSGENGTIGDFLLILLGEGAPTSMPLDYGQPVDVTLPAGASPQHFTFLTEACPTTLMISNPSAGQPFTFPYLIKVRDQRGQIVAILRGGEQLEDWVTVAPRSGQYDVEVAAADPALAGSLRLLVTCAGDNPGCSDRPAIPGIPVRPDALCLPCPGPEELITGRGCPDLGLIVTQIADDPPEVIVTWDISSGAEGYAVYVYGLSHGGIETYLTHAEWRPGDPAAFTWVLPEGYDEFRFVLRAVIGDETVCTDEARLELEGRLIPVIPCQVRADRAGVAARVGPGMMRAIFTSLTAGVAYPVLGFATAADGSLWWQIDKTLFPGHEVVTSLWVAADDVIAEGACDEVPPGEVPPLIPESEPRRPPGWLPCGSCDTCGHPAEECVTSPEGICLWDPASCTGGPPPEDDGDCYTINVTIDMGDCYGPGSAMLDVAPNCAGGRYLPGTVMAAHAVAVDSKCNVNYWSGCGASGTDNDITFIATSSCTLTAHMHYGD